MDFTHQHFEDTKVNRWSTFLTDCKGNLNDDIVIEGRLKRIVGLTLEVTGCSLGIGARCLIETKDHRHIEAQVVGFTDEKTYLMAIDDMRGLVPNAKVIPVNSSNNIALGKDMLGRVVDGAGHPLDDKGQFVIDEYRTLEGISVNPLLRRPISEVLDVGVRAINGLTPIGRGQRMGLFAGSGVGKSVLLGMMTRFTDADIVVVGLIGERGREVNEFVQEILGEEGLKKAVVVAVPADHTPLLRLNGAMLATTIAEFFRDQGNNVLLLMDSLTRFAQAQREIALAVGEPPATKGYPPSVFSLLPKLVERAGNCGSRLGSITAFYTVLVEGDDEQDPVADAARAILDGHIVLSRKMAEAGIFPAINLEASISRLMNVIAKQDQQRHAQHFREVLSCYNSHKDLINIGMYKKGSDSLIDKAIYHYPRFMEYIKQDMSVKYTLPESLHYLQEVLSHAE